MSETFPKISGYLRKDTQPDPVPRPIIPTEGFATSALDLCRYSGLVGSTHSEFNFAYTDRHTFDCLHRLMVGPIQSVDDLAGAENALQLILWHDVIEVLSPALRVTHSGGAGSGAATYFERTDPSFKFYPDQSGIPSSVVELLHRLQAGDGYLTQECFVAPEELHIVDGVVASGSDLSSPLIGTPWTETRDVSQHSQKHWLAVGALPLDLATSAYFSHPKIPPYTGSRGFLEAFYTAVKEPWALALKEIPSASVTIEMPPLVAIVLNMSASRAGIPDAIEALRQQLRDARKEMRGFNIEQTKVGSQKELLALCRHLQAAFEATMVVAQMTNAARRRHNIFRALTLGNGLRSPLDAAMKMFIKDFTSDSPIQLVDRTTTTRQFSRLLDTETIYGLLDVFLTDAERLDLHRSIEMQKRQT